MLEATAARRRRGRTKPDATSPIAKIPRVAGAGEDGQVHCNGGVRRESLEADGPIDDGMPELSLGRGELELRQREDAKRDRAEAKLEQIQSVNPRLGACVSIRLDSRHNDRSNNA